MTEIAIGFIKRIGSSETNLDLRYTLDQMEYSKCELGKNDTITSSNYLATSPMPITAPRDAPAC